MRQLTTLESALLLLGGLLMVVGSGATVLLQPWAAYVFAPGALLFAAMQMRQRYDGPNFVVRRLRRRGKRQQQGRPDGDALLHVFLSFPVCSDDASRRPK